MKLEEYFETLILPTKVIVYATSNVNHPYARYVSRGFKDDPSHQPYLGCTVGRIPSNVNSLYKEVVVEDVEN